jgi:hypothetical protein
MLADSNGGDIDGFATWEPWPTRTLMAVKGTKILQDAAGIYNNINFVYMNRGWIEQNQETAQKFIRALIEANDLIGNDRPAAAKMVAKFLKMPLELATELMPKVEFDMTWTDRAVATIKVAEEQLTKQRKLKAPPRLMKYVYSDLIKKVRPENVMITALPTKWRERTAAGAGPLTGCRGEAYKGQLGSSPCTFTLRPDAPESIQRRDERCIDARAAADAPRERGSLSRSERPS